MVLVANHNNIIATGISSTSDESTKYLGKSRFFCKTGYYVPYVTIVQQVCTALSKIRYYSSTERADVHRNNFNRNQVSEIWL